MQWLVEHAARILTASILINCAPFILLRQQLLDLPIPLLGTNAKLQILFRDRIPVFVHHHYGQ